jgi:hypothetical protein
MRSLTTAFVLLILAGCATPRVVTPREYLDEITAATVTVVADPWIYSEKRTRSDSALMDRRSTAVGAFTDEPAPGERDFLSVYAIDVNRMGSHRQYLAVLQSLPRVGKPDAAGAAPTLELQVAGQTLSLQPITETPRELGIAQAPASAETRESRWWYFPIGKEALTAMAASRDLQAALLIDGDRTAYEIWRDGSAELAELTTVLR